MTRLSLAASIEPDPRSADPRSTLALVDAYLDLLGSVTRGREPSPGRTIAVAGQLAQVARAIIDRVGIEVALVRRGQVLVPMAAGHRASLLVIDLVDLDVQAEQRYEAELLELGRRLMAGEPMLADEDHQLRGALLLLTDCDRAECDQILDALAESGGSPEAFDMAAFAALARAHLEAERDRSRGPKLSQGTVPPESTGPIVPDYDPLHHDRGPKEAPEGID